MRNSTKAEKVGGPSTPRTRMKRTRGKKGGKRAPGMERPASASCAGSFGVRPVSLSLFLLVKLIRTNQGTRRHHEAPN
jgi:hypothetical protein